MLNSNFLVLFIFALIMHILDGSYSSKIKYIIIESMLKILGIIIVLFFLLIVGSVIYIYIKEIIIGQNFSVYLRVYLLLTILFLIFFIPFGKNVKNN